MASYQEYTFRSSVAPKRWVHKKRFKQAIKLLELKPDDTLLDYGCGGGYLLELAGKIVPSDRLYGFDPSESMRKLATENLVGKTKIFANIDKLRGMKFTKIACLETLEHLPDELLHEALNTIDSLLTENGKVLISVPVEIGLSAVVKNTFRAVFGNLRHLTLKTFTRTALGLPCEREIPQDFDGLPFIYSHICFDYRRFEKLLSKVFKIKKKVFSPVPALGPILNNIVFFVCEKLNMHSNSQ